MFEWEVTIYLHDDTGKVVQTLNEKVYAATLHDAKGKAASLAEKVAHTVNADFWSIGEVK